MKPQQKDTVLALILSDLERMRNALAALVVTADYMASFEHPSALFALYAEVLAMRCTAARSVLSDVPPLIAPLEMAPIPLTLVTRAATVWVHNKETRKWELQR